METDPGQRPVYNSVAARRSRREVKQKPYAYFDTSIVAKRYLRESGSKEANALLRRYRVMSSTVTPIELQSLIHRSYLEQILTDSQRSAVLKKFQTDRT